MKVSEAQMLVDDYIKSFKEGYFPPYTNLVRLMEEVGELSKEFNHNFGPLKKIDKSSNARLVDELGDVFFAICVLANQLDIELKDALELTLRKYQKRDSTRWTPKED